MVLRDVKRVNGVNVDGNDDAKMENALQMDPQKSVFTHPAGQYACAHTRFRQVEKRNSPGRVNILVVCRACRRAGEEIIQISSNSQSVYAKKTFRWLDV